MGYFTIPLAECSKDVTTIVTEFGKFRYTCLPMGMVISGDVFQAKVYDLIGDIEGVRTYINDILCIGKGTFQEHLDQLEEIFRHFSKAGLKVNAPKCSFGLKEIPHIFAKIFHSYQNRKKEEENKETFSNTHPAFNRFSTEKSVTSGKIWQEKKYDINV